MNSYFQFVHNLKGGAKFESFKPEVKKAIISHFIRQLNGLNALEQSIVQEANEEVLAYISRHLDLKTYYKSIIFTTAVSSYIDEVDFNHVRAIINLQQVNHIQHPNKLLRAVNTLLPDNGIFIGRLQTYGERKEKIYRRVGQNPGRFMWMADFMIHRVIPRLPYLDDLYYYLTNGRFHAISEAEVLGRLVYCGFEIVEITSIQGLSYFVALKVKKPLEAPNPSCYPIIKLNRVGKNGNMINVYKFRTMHPYSEYIQDYVIRLHGYNKRGKPAGDFRVTRWGKMFRKLWIDELPQLINVIRGEMKLVGLRPISRVRYTEFPIDLQRQRIRYKPGCLPPYVALNMPDDKANIEAERIYIRDLSHNPYTTDLNYLVKALYNILANKIRSS